MRTPPDFVFNHISTCCAKVRGQDSSAARSFGGFDGKEGRMDGQVLSLSSKERKADSFPLADDLLSFLRELQDEQAFDKYTDEGWKSQQCVQERLSAQTVERQPDYITGSQCWKMPVDPGVGVCVCVGGGASLSSSPMSRW